MSGLFADFCLPGSLLAPSRPPQSSQAAASRPGAQHLRALEVALPGGCRKDGLEQDASCWHWIMKRIYYLHYQLYGSQMVVSINPVIFRWVQ